ncbi:MAG: DMT family transporter [Melioribacteraceae bacterium]|nr:DMT family transporter [Melioribacteraceae bacterium]
MSDSVNPKKLKFLSEIILLSITLFWGGTFAIVKESLNDASALMFIAIRFSIAALILLILFYRQIKNIDKESLKHGFILGVFLFLGFALQTAGLKFTTATKSGFITGSLVVMIPIFQTVIEKRPPTLGAIFGTVFVFVGIVFLSSGGNSFFAIFEELGANFNIGDLLSLFCAVAFALYIVFLDIYSYKHDFKILTFLQVAVTAGLAFVITFLFDVTNIEAIEINVTGNLIFGLLYTAIFASVMATMLQTKYQKNVTPTKAGIIFSFEPIFAAIFAFFLLSEKITNLGFIGCTLIFSGLLISELYENLVKANGK